MNELSDGAMETIENQGWCEDSVIILMSRYIQSKGLYRDFENWLEHQANEENYEANATGGGVRGEDGGGGTNRSGEAVPDHEGSIGAPD